MNENFEIPQINKNEVLEITDTSSFKEALKKEELEPAYQWIQLKRAVFDEWKQKNIDILDELSPEEQQSFETTLKEKMRALDHRENELSKIYREKKMWAEAKNIISQSIKEESFEPRKNRLEEQSGIEYDDIPEKIGF